MNATKAKRLKLTAQRTIDIINKILEGYSDKDIVMDLECSRQLVEYYRNTLEKED